jgi:arsenate reductase
MMAGPRLTMYQKPTCTTCKQVMMILQDSGVDFDAIDYIIDPIGLPKLRDLVRKLGVSPRELVRTREQAWADLGPARDALSDEQILRVLADNPELLQRPILELGDRAVLARPAQRAREILR